MCNCGYALLVGEFQRVGVDLQAAVEQTDVLIGLKAEGELVVPEPYVPPVDNDAALRELNQMMRGL